MERDQGNDVSDSTEFLPKITPSSSETSSRVSPVWPEVSAEGEKLYTPLPPNSFRFAHMLPGAPEDVVKVRLTTNIVMPNHDDDSSLRWEALSWLWGAYGDFRTIIVNDQTFKVTRNLFIALRHLRSRHSVRILWVDALCINQADIAERSSQISQMAFLYHKAERVIAWLGEGDPGSQIVMKLANYLHDFENGRLVSCDDNLMYILALSFGVPQIKANSSDSLFHYWNIHRYENWSHIDRLAERELFRRSWVLQEGALARELVVQCGTDMISWDALFRATSLRYEYDRRARQSSVISEGWSAMQAIETLRRLIATRQRPPDLLELLWACRNYKSTDPRDRIFALLGVSNLLYGHGPSQQLGFEIDYAKSVTEIFRSFTLSMIKKYQDLRVLATRRPHRAYDDQGLGSWCPNWSAIDGGVSLLYLQRQWSGNMVRYNASGGVTVPRFHIVKDFEHGGHIDCLVLRGFKLDVIAAVRHSSHFESDSTRLYNWHHWAVWPEEREWTETPRSRDQADPERQDAFWRTVIADADANGNRHPVYLRSQFQAWYGKIVEGFKTSNDFSAEIPDAEEYKDFLNRMRQVTTGRCMFETKEYSFLGIGDEDHSAEQGGPQLQSGDIIAILDGGPLPVILREVPNQVDSSGLVAYRLVGDAFCYVHGAVDGEALRLGGMRQDFAIV